jgi:hypothetical protein
MTEWGRREGVQLVLSIVKDAGYSINVALLLKSMSTVFLFSLMFIHNLVFVRCIIQYSRIFGMAMLRSNEARPKSNKTSYTVWK